MSSWIYSLPNSTHYVFGGKIKYLRFWRENHGFTFLAGKSQIYDFSVKITNLRFW
ncbi:unnamed protein product, partial [Arabidopsis halleri]